MKNLIFTEQDFLNLFTLPKPSFAEFCNQIQILNISDKSGTFVVRQDLDSFIARVAKKDNRAQRLPLFKQKLYEILVIDIEKTLIALLYRDWETDRKSTRLNSSHSRAYRMPSSA